MLDNKFNPKDAEPRLYKMWEESGAFKPRSAKPTDTKDDNFSIVIPPPNVTGSLHMGHAVNNTIQDILVRYNRMKGKAVLWQPGTDHAGIATQMVVERKLAAEGKARKDMTRDEFLEHVWAWKAESGGNINQQLRRLGSSCDWSREKFTLGNPEDPNDKMAEAVTKAFVEMYEAGLIYRDKRLVNWDPHFQTAISDLEVENIEKDGHFWHFKYPLDGGETYTYVEKDEDGNITLSEERDYISIATTRPETMLGDGAVAVHPDDERYAPIVGKMVRLPLAGRLIPIITDEYPDPDFGSGAVKITGAHDFNDYEVATRNNIPMYSLMDERGAMCESEIMPAKYVGMDRFKARKEVVADIDAEGLLIKVEDKKIMQPYGDRSGVVIEPMLTDQWFVAADKLAGEAMEAVARGHDTHSSPSSSGEDPRTHQDNEAPSNGMGPRVKPEDDGSSKGNTRFIPENWKKTYDHWMKDIQPWCISRQLWWGHRIPAWYGPTFDPDTKEVDYDNPRGKFFVAENEDDLLDQAAVYYSRDETGLCFDVVEDDVIFEIVVEERRHDHMVPLQRDPDVLDTWFSSGLWPIGTLGWPEETDELKKYFPTSVLITGFDIIFFWVARMMMMQYAMVGERPFDTVYVHALVRDEKGKKMSKSLGNVLDPLELVDEYGADAVRFTLTSMAAMGRDLKLSTQRIQGYRNFTTKLWNAARFAEMNGVFDVTTRTPDVATHSVNKWIIGEVARTRMALDDALTSFRFNDAANTLYAFTYTYCDWYLEFSKPLMQSQAADETRQTMAWALDQLLIMLHPIMPFITEELWGLSAPTRKRPCVHADWPTYGAEMIDDAAVSELNWVRDLIEKTRSVRGEMNVPKKEKVTLLQLSLDSEQDAIWARNKALILADREAGIAGRDTAEAAPKGAATIAVDGGTFALPLAGLINADAEKARLEKTVGKLQKDLGGLEGRLKNPKFRENAGADVVAETEDLAASKREELTRLNAALARLAEIT